MGLLPAPLAYTSPAQRESAGRPVLAAVGAGLAGLFVWLLLAVSLALVLAGAYLPALKVTQAFAFESDYALVDAVRSFFAAGQAELGLLLLLVTLVLPSLKILIGAMLVLTPSDRPRPRLIGLLLFLSRWSLTDVFMLAVVILVLNAQVITRADLGPGAWLFAAGILLSTAAIELLRRRTWDRAKKSV